ncbi:MAG: hypothetical protein Fur0046_03340 [Cyanobacteria bacterium J069]
MVFILVIVVALVAWALHLMQEALDRKEFSLMLAGFLVSVAAAALVAVYFLVGHFVGYMDQMSQRAELTEQYYETAEFVFPSELIVEEPILNYAEMTGPAQRFAGAVSIAQP